MNPETLPVKYGKVKVQCLMYADDLVLLSNTSTGMQKALNILNLYCKTWKMEINLTKTKVMCFNINPSTVKFKYGENNIDETSEYQYLGIVFTNKGNFKTAIDELCKTTLKVYFKLMQSMRPYPSIKTCLHLFDHLMKPILLHGCEIWGPINIKVKSDAVETNSNLWKQLQYEFPIEHKFNITPPAYEKIH